MLLFWIEIKMTHLKHVCLFNFIRLAAVLLMQHTWSWDQSYKPWKDLSTGWYSKLSTAPNLKAHVVKQDLEFRSQGPTSCSFVSQMHGKNSQFFQLEDRISSNVRVRTGDKRLGFDLLLPGKRWARKSLNLWSGKGKGLYFIERRSQHCTETSVAVATWFTSCGSQQPEAMWLSSPADANPWTWQLQPQETKS